MTTPPTPTLLAGFLSGAPYAYYDVTEYDDGSEYAPDQILHDISLYGRDQALTITRGVSSIVTTGFPANAGTAQGSLSNHDRRFDPNNTAGPYTVNSKTAVVPGVPIVAQVTYASTTYSLFSGLADDWPQSYPLVGNDQMVGLQATDATGIFAQAQLTIARPAELSGARINAIIEAVGYTGPTAIASGNTMIAPLTATTTTAQSHLQDVVNAEWGDLYIAKDGTLTFRSRDQILSQTRSSTSQATFGDQSPELAYSDVTLASPPIVNDVSIQWNSTGSIVTAQNALSKVKQWGTRSLTLTLPFNDVTVAQQYANWIVMRYGFPIVTFESITINDRRTAGLYAQMFGRELGDRITVKRTPLGGGSRIVDDVFIRGITISYKDWNWSAKFTLQDASWTTAICQYDVNLYDDGSVYSF